MKPDNETLISTMRLRIEKRTILVTAYASQPDIKCPKQVKVLQQLFVRGSGEQVWKDVPIVEATS